MFAAQRCGIARRLAQLFDEVYGACVIIIVPELYAGRVRVLASSVEHLLANLATVFGGFLDDLDLGQMRCEVAQPVFVLFRELISNQHQKVEIFIGLGRKAG